MLAYIYKYIIRNKRHADIEIDEIKSNIRQIAKSHNSKKNEAGVEMYNMRVYEVQAKINNIRNNVLSGIETGESRSDINYFPDSGSVTGEDESNEMRIEFLEKMYFKSLKRKQTPLT